MLHFINTGCGCCINAETVTAIRVESAGEKFAVVVYSTAEPPFTIATEKQQEDAEEAMYTLCQSLGMLVNFLL